ncbi:MAG: methyl-accepting chemotaxis protein [Actinomycetota bacterium]|nr:methyl-accepting chemotaxis protein [Actinomycetota bacterium]
MTWWRSMGEMTERPSAAMGSDDLLGGLSRQVLDAAGASVFVLDARFALVYQNGQATESLKLLPDDARRSFLGSLTELARGGRGSWEDSSGTAAGGHWQETTAAYGRSSLSVRSAPVHALDGTLAGYVITWEDSSAAQHARARVLELTAHLSTVQEVSAAVQSVAGATEEMVSSISEIARNSTEANATVSAAVDSVKAANKTMAELGHASTQISTIVKTITAVAEQTNLLALNATIESARAGEAGRGFAVVANEVKELSQQTRTATQEINRMIEGIQNLSTQAITAIGEISHVVDRIRDNQSSIAGAVEEQTATTNEISSSLVKVAERAEKIANLVSSQAD